MYSLALTGITIQRRQSQQTKCALINLLASSLFFFSPFRFNYSLTPRHYGRSATCFQRSGLICQIWLVRCAIWKIKNRPAYRIVNAKSRHTSYQAMIDPSCQLINRLLIKIPGLSGSPTWLRWQILSNVVGQHQRNGRSTATRLVTFIAIRPWRRRSK
jgi:hypothetical protein